MRTGLYISGTAHGALILWVLFGAWFAPTDRDELPDTVQVSVVSAAEFAAITASDTPPETVPDVVAPQTPDAPGTPPPPAPVTRPETPQTPTPPTPTPVQPDAPEPPEVPTPPAPVTPVEPAPTAPDPVEPPEVVALAPIATRPVLRPSERVAPTPTEAPDPDTTIDVDTNQAIAPDAPDVVETPPESETETAPEQASDRIVAEADAPAASAPATSPRPALRPSRPAPTETPAETPTETPSETPPETTTADTETASNGDILAALTEANDTPQTPSAPAGPPLSASEIEGFKSAVGQCWNHGAMSTDAQRTVVVVMVEFDRNGKPGTPELISSTGPNDAATAVAFRMARSAIARCAGDGYDLPPEKYDTWKRTEFTFDPAKMRTR